MKTQRLLLSPENQPDAFPRFKNLLWHARHAQLKNLDLGFSRYAMHHALCAMRFSILRCHPPAHDPNRSAKEKDWAYGEGTPGCLWGEKTGRREKG